MRSETKNLTFHSLNLLHKLRWNFTTTCHSRVDLGTSDLIYTELISYTKNSIFSHLTQRFCLCDSFLVCECFSHCVYQFFAALVVWLTLSSDFSPSQISQRSSVFLNTIRDFLCLFILSLSFLGSTLKIVKKEKLLFATLIKDCPL